VMAFLFGGGDKTPTPAVPVPDPPPTIEDAATKVRDDSDAAMRRKGMAANMLTGKQGAGTPTAGTKVLLGG